MSEQEKQNNRVSDCMLLLFRGKCENGRYLTPDQAESITRELQERRAEDASTAEEAVAMTAALVGVEFHLCGGTVREAESMRNQDIDYQGLSDAFVALFGFVNTELNWEFFRAEWLESHKESKAATAKNAVKLREFLEGLRRVPVVDKCLRDADQ